MIFQEPIDEPQSCLYDRRPDLRGHPASHVPKIPRGRMERAIESLAIGSDLRLPSGGKAVPLTKLSGGIAPSAP